MNIDKMIEKWQEEFAFCEQQEMFNTKNKEYITAHNHAVRKEQIRLFIKDLQQVKNLNIPVVINHGCSDCGGKLEYDVMDYWQCSICGKPQ